MTPIILFWTSVIAIIIVYELGGNIDSRSSQSSVDQLSKDLEKISTQEHVDHKFTEVKGSFDKVKGSFDLITHTIQSNQKVTDKNFENMNQFLNSIRTANTDSGSVKEAFATLNGLMSDNGMLRLEVNKLYSDIVQKNLELVQKDENIQTLMNEIEAIKMQLEELTHQLEMEKNKAMEVISEKETLKQEYDELKEDYEELLEQQNYHDYDEPTISF